MPVHAFLPPESLEDEVLLVHLVDEPGYRQHLLRPSCIFMTLDGSGVVVDGKLRTEPVLACHFPYPVPLFETRGPGLHVEFTIGAMRRLFHLDPASIGPGVVALDRPDLLDLADRCRTAKGNDAARALFDDLETRLPDKLPLDLAEAARARLYWCTTRKPIDELAAELGSTPRTVQRRFKERFGITPSRYQRSARAIRSIFRSGTPPRWDEVPPDCDYVDQSHWLRDLHEVFGFQRAAVERQSLEWRFYPPGSFDPEEADAETFQAAALERFHRIMPDNPYLAVETE